MLIRTRSISQFCASLASAVVSPIGEGLEMVTGAVWPLVEVLCAERPVVPNTAAMPISPTATNARFSLHTQPLLWAFRPDVSNLSVAPWRSLATTLFRDGASSNMQVWLSPALRNTGLRSFNDVTRIFPCSIVRTNL